MSKIEPTPKAGAKLSKNAVYSMTGYANIQQHIKLDLGASCGLNLELRSVNSRFLDLQFKLSDDLRAHETALRSCLNQQLRRGKVEIKANLLRDQESSLVEPNAHLLQRLNHLQNTVQNWLPNANSLSVAEVLQLAQQNVATKTIEEAAIVAALNSAIAELKLARSREGARLKNILLKCLTEIQELVQQAAVLVPQAIEQQRQKFLQRWQETLQLSNADAAVSQEAMQEKALSEMVVYTIRIDVAEELARLGSHLTEIKQLLSNGGTMGKKLDFMVQELLREANTIASKSSSLELSKIALEMKVLIEQLREQVQNIE